MLISQHKILSFLVCQPTFDPRFLTLDSVSFSIIDNLLLVNNPIGGITILLDSHTLQDGSNIRFPLRVADVEITPKTDSSGAQYKNQDANCSGKKKRNYSANSTKTKKKIKTKQSASVKFIFRILYQTKKTIMKSGNPKSYIHVNIYPHRYYFIFIRLRPEKSQILFQNPIQSLPYYQTTKITSISTETLLSTSNENWSSDTNSWSKNPVTLHSTLP